MEKKSIQRFLIIQMAVLAGLISCTSSDENEAPSVEQVIAKNKPSTNWIEYNGNGDRSHYSELSQIKKENVAKLKIAWAYSSVGSDSVLSGTQMQCNPIIVDGILYGVSAKTQVFALDAATGK
jgi:quinoprotein glucose dehydrogenase